MTRGLWRALPTWWKKRKSPRHRPKNRWKERWTAAPQERNFARRNAKRRGGRYNDASQKDPHKSGRIKRQEPQDPPRWEARLEETADDFRRAPEPEFSVHRGPGRIRPEDFLHQDRESGRSRARNRD